MSVSSTASSVSALVQEVVEIDDRGRILVPQRVWGPVTWLSGETWPKDALLVLGRPGIAQILDWQAHAAVLSERRAALSSDASEEALETLSALEERYHRIAAAESRRFTLSLLVQTHLEVAPGDRLYVEANSTMLQFVSIHFRNTRLAARARAIADLP